MCAAFCSCATLTSRMPAPGKRSRASMYAEPTMPNTSFTLCATRVSTKASDGVMRTFPPAGLVVAVRFFASVMMFMGILQSWVFPGQGSSVTELF
jgi:hypothetical protein